jgi:hypothetical protein
MALASVALASARSYLNDIGQQIWTDAILLPYLKEAHKDLLLVLWLNGIPVIREKSASIGVTAGVLTLTLPSDLLEPIWLKERAVGGTNQDWIPMTETDFEPDRLQTDTLRYWAWREEAINFIGATTNRQVLLQYWKSIADIVDANSALGFLMAEVFLGPQCAGYAANATGNTTLAGELSYINGVNVGVAGAKLDMIIRANVKGQQNLPARRIPYRRFARSRLLL